MADETPTLEETQRMIALMHLEQLKDMEPVRNPSDDDRNSHEVIDFATLEKWSNDHSRQIKNAVQNRKW
jgi:hypothetical protein